MALCSAALFLWALCYRLPASGNLLKVHARQSPPVETNPPVTAEVLATLREQVRERSMNLIHARREIPALLSKLDAKARELGWRCDGSLKAPVTAPGGVQELTLHPVTIELRYDYVEPERAYRHLLAWLWAATTLHPRAEVTSLTLQSLGHGLNAAQVELSFFSLNSNEENPPK